MSAESTKKAYFEKSPHPQPSGEFRFPLGAAWGLLHTHSAGGGDPASRPLSPLLAPHTAFARVHSPQWVSILRFRYLFWYWACLLRLLPFSLVQNPVMLLFSAVTSSWPRVSPQAWISGRNSTGHSPRCSFLTAHSASSHFTDRSMVPSVGVSSSFSPPFP